MAKTNTLRKLLEDGAHTLSQAFSVAGRRSSHYGATEKLGSGQSAATGGAKAGQVSVFGLRPISMGEKLKHIAQMIKKGTVALGNGISLDTIRDEMKKHDGLGIHQMVEVLAKKNLLKLAKKPAPAAPAPA